MRREDIDIRQVANLARLHLEQAELEQYGGELANILAFVEQIDAVDTRNVDPMAHPLDMVQRLREDTADETDRREQYQACAPSVDNGLYLVPKVIE